MIPRGGLKFIIDKITWMHLLIGRRNSREESGNNVWPTTGDFNASIYEEEHRLNLSRERKSIRVSILFKLLTIASLCHSNLLT